MAVFKSVDDYLASTKQSQPKPIPMYQPKLYGPANPATGKIGGMSAPKPQLQKNDFLGNVFSGVTGALGGIAKAPKTLAENVDFLIHKPNEFVRGTELGLKEADKNVSNYLKSNKTIGPILKDLQTPINLKDKKALDERVKSSVNNLMFLLGAQAAPESAAGKAGFNFIKEEAPNFLQKVKGFLSGTSQAKSPKEINLLEGVETKAPKEEGILPNLTRILKTHEDPYLNSVGQELEKLNPDANVSEIQSIASKLKSNPNTYMQQVGGELEKLSGSGDGESNTINKIIQGIREAKPIRSQQEAIYTTERGGKFAKAERAYQEAGGGEAGTQAMFKALGGEMEKVKFEPIRGRFDDQELTFLRDYIQKSSKVDFGEKLTAHKALSDLLGEVGVTVPNKSGLAALTKVFGKDFVVELEKKATLPEKADSLLNDLLQAPRSLRSSLDFSAPFRQGLFLINHPKEFTRAFGKMFQSAFSAKAFAESNARIKGSPLYGLMKEAKLYLPEVEGPVSQREEAFMSLLPERIPVLKNFIQFSNRNYTTFLNELRSGVFTTLYENAERAGLQPAQNPKLLESLGRFINTASGRGSLKIGPGVLNWEKAAVPLNSAFFSPRLLASRIQLLNPLYYKSLDPFVRKEALKSLFSVLGLGAGIASLAKMNGAEVSLDPRNSDFGKIKFGNTRFDIWGGLQQDVVAATRFLTNQYVSSTTGKVTQLGEGYKPTTRLDIAGRFLRSKLAPVPALGVNLAEGKNSIGEPVTPLGEARNLLQPMITQDVLDLVQQQPDLIPASLLGVFGVGVQTYGPKSNNKPPKLGRPSSASRPSSKRTR